MKKGKWFWPSMAVMLFLQLTAVLYFCNLKQGFHYDEYYSYYSSNATNALFMPEEGWKDVDEIRSEFQVSSDESLNYGLVNEMQSLDVHPPLYYFLLHTVCGLSRDVFSKWQGIAINLVFFVLSWWILVKITGIFTENRLVMMAVCLLFGFSPAVYSGVTFIRMYTMLSFECLLFLYIHLKALKEDKFTWKNFYLPVAVVSFLGFYTHYYFAVFLFFLALSVFIYFLTRKGSRGKAFLYAVSTGIGLLAVVMVYPASLRHIFRGYRGTEAMDAFFSFSNIFERLNFFYDLTNEYAFGGTLSFLLIVAVLLLLTVGFLQKRHGRKRIGCHKEMTVTVVTVLGYFLVVAKTALLNAEEAIRYEMPIYGLLILIMILGIYNLLEACLQNEGGKASLKRKRIQNGILIAVLGIVLLGQLLALYHKKVCFLYEDDLENIEWAGVNKDAAVAYIYQPDKSWMIWDESLELMQYDNIYFLSNSVDSVKEDLKLKRAEEIYVYSMRGENSEKVLKMLQKENGKTDSCEKVRELLYCDLYLLR